MQDPTSFNLRHVKENKQTTKIADMQFKQLVKSMDKSHNQFIKVMRTDPSVDVEKLEKHFGKNYTDMIRIREISAIGVQESKKRQEEDAKREEADGVLENDAVIDSFDLRRLKQGKFNFIGVEPRVDTNRYIKTTTAQSNDATD